MAGQVTEAEKAYQAALALEAMDEGAAFSAYQQVVDQYPESLWSDRAASALDRIEGATQYLRQGRVVHVPPELSCRRNPTIGHGLATTLQMIILAIVVGPFFAGVWSIFFGLALSVIPLFYWIGWLPAAISGLLFAGWGLRYCSVRSALPDRTLLAGVVCGLMGAAIGAVVILFLWPMPHVWLLVTGFVLLVGFVIDGNPTVAILCSLLLFVFHGALGGAAVGWLGGKLLRYRMDTANDP